MPEATASRISRLWRFVRSHPVTTGVFVFGAVAGATAAICIPLGSEGLSPVARGLAGALLGAWLAMFPLGFRLFE